MRNLFHSLPTSPLPQFNIRFFLIYILIIDQLFNAECEWHHHIYLQTDHYIFLFFSIYNRPFPECQFQIEGTTTAVLRKQFRVTLNVPMILTEVKYFGFPVEATKNASSLCTNTQNKTKITFVKVRTTS